MTHLLATHTLSFTLDANFFCDVVPTEVSALSSNVFQKWDLVDDNLIGEHCGARDMWPALPTTIPTSVTVLNFYGEEFTGTIPTEFGLLTEAIEMHVDDNGTWVTNSTWCG